jgi:hypothetical protein
MAPGNREAPDDEQVTRLAVAVRPPEAVLDVLAGLPRPPVPGVVWARRQQWIVKVRPLGHVDLRVVEPLVEALEDELAAAPPVPCTLGPRTVRLGGQWLGVPVDGLGELGAAVFMATTPIVPVTHPQPFHAEVVLARGRVPADLAGQPVETAFVVDRLLLVADRSAPGRPALVDLAEIALTQSRATMGGSVTAPSGVQRWACRDRAARPERRWRS